MVAGELRKEQSASVMMNMMIILSDMDMDRCGGRDGTLYVACVIHS